MKKASSKVEWTDDGGKEVKMNEIVAISHQA